MVRMSCYWLQFGLYLSLFFIESPTAYGYVLDSMGVILVVHWASLKW
jgi:hypothetical protein